MSLTVANSSNILQFLEGKIARKYLILINIPRGARDCNLLAVPLPPNKVCFGPKRDPFMMGSFQEKNSNIFRRFLMSD
jgi:hypothetical protein